MSEAIADAQANVDQFIAVLREPQPNQGSFAILAPVPDGDGSQHLWLSQVEYADGVFTGVVNSKPESVSGVQLGDRVQVPKDEISDWMYREDGKVRGGYTTQALNDSLALFERLSPTSQVVVGVALLLSLAFVAWLVTRRSKG